MVVVVQQADFDLNQEYQTLIEGNQTDGAVVTFCGLVRDFNQGHEIIGLTLEHYPAMTLKALEKIETEARERWTLGRVTIIHRVGDLDLGDQIVFVGVSSRHRKDAYAASQFIMDTLKTDAPFWKKERTTTGPRWVESEMR